MFTNMVARDFPKFASPDTIKTHGNDYIETRSSGRGASIVNPITAQKDRTF